MTVNVANNTMTAATAMNMTVMNERRNTHLHNN